jgi:hypothetical protein
VWWLIRGPSAEVAAVLQCALSAAQAGLLLTDPEAPTSETCRAVKGLAETMTLDYGRKSVIMGLMNVPNALTGLANVLQVASLSPFTSLTYCRM